MVKRHSFARSIGLVLPLLMTFACSSRRGTLSGVATTGGLGDNAGSTTRTATLANRLNAEVQTIVFIYAENRSFDGLFGNFPGARGLSDVVNADGSVKAGYDPQKDRDGATVLGKLPKTWGGATHAGNPTTVSEAQTDGLANRPFSIERAFVGNGAPALTTSDVTRDLGHRFFENIMQINGGTNDAFAAWSDAGGLTMGHWDYSQTPMFELAQKSVLLDDFFEGAYGGSFLNHQYLICACAPALSAAVAAANPGAINVLGAPNARGVPQLAQNANSPASALDGKPNLKTGYISPLDYFGPGDGYRGVNTMQPPYQPSGNAPAATDTDFRYVDPALGNTVPPQTQPNIGDALTAKGIDWAWYATYWDAATADGSRVSTAARSVIYAPSGPRAEPNFQPHHQPFNYFAEFDPATHAAERAAHLKDYQTLLAQIAAGTLPPVVFYKPSGKLNLHPGYANLDDGDAHIVSLVDRLKASPQWAHMVIVITYDEYGGQWDHVAPPKGDLLGPGTRVPAIVVSPFAKNGTIDHTQYDSASILRLIARRFSLPPLEGVTKRDQALVRAGGVAMGDLTNALNL
jgi:acid phosphatase